MKSEEDMDDIANKVATEFVLEVINTAMSKYQVSFETVNTVLTELGLWEIFNDSEVTCVGAHEGIDDIIKEIGEKL